MSIFHKNINFLGSISFHYFKNANFLFVSLLSTEWYAWRTCTYIYFVPTYLYSALNMVPSILNFIHYGKLKRRKCEMEIAIFSAKCMKTSQCSDAKVETDRYVQIRNWTGKWMKKACHILTHVKLFVWINVIPYCIIRIST